MAKQFCIVNIEGGIIQNRKPAVLLFKSLKDGKYLLEISNSNKRSNPQNRYYWGLVVPMIQKGIEDMGTELTKEETHEFLKARFNASDLINEGTGEAISIPKSTTGLSKEKFGEYISKIQQFSAEFLQMIIPDPGQQVTIEYENND